MNTTNMLKLLIKYLFLTIFILNYKAFSQININKWIEKPKKEKYYNPLIYIDFWATWCAPCISSIPHIQGLEEKFGDKVLFIYISNEPENKIKSFMSGRNLHFYSANDTDEFNFKKFNIEYLPTSLILDPNGNVVWKGKPGDLNEKILKKLIVKYDDKRGKRRRIKLKKNDNKNDNFEGNLKNGQKFSLKYQKFDYAVPYKFVHQNNKIMYQGDLKSILADMLSVKPYQIQFKEEMSYWEVFFDAPSDETKVDIAISFLMSAGYEWKLIEKEIQIYQLSERDTSLWLNSQLYQYTESPDQSLSIIDDYFLTVDNASPGLLADILSEKTPWIFIYKGDINKIYDWNIQINSLKNLLNNLIEDLDFKVKKKSKKMPVYVIKKMRN